MRAGEQRLAAAASQLGVPDLVAFWHSSPWHRRGRSSLARTAEVDVRQAAKRTILVSRKPSSMILALLLFSCAGMRPTNLGVHGALLAPCPSSPNCVSSDAKDSSHQVPAFQLALPAGDAWPVVREAVASLPRTAIITESPDYLHAECSSAIFGFVDDLELHLRTAQGLIAVRSASRLGYGDLGVNRRRVENLRDFLAQRGVVR